MHLRCLREVTTLVVLALPVALDAQPGVDTLRIGVVLSRATPYDSVRRSIARGIELGTEEAARTAALFGFTIQTIWSTDVDSSTVNAFGWLLDRRASAVVVAGDPDGCAALSQIAATRPTVVLTLDCQRDFHAAHPCARTVFHLWPSDTTRAYARALASRDNRDSASSEERVVVWHHSLARFGADQLNERFLRRFGVAMESWAWAGWLSMKILAEAALRTRSAQASELARYLVRRDTRFDGHKGEPLTFESRTGELRQPLYLLSGGSGGDERVRADLKSGMLFGDAAARGDRRGECSAGSGLGIR